MFISVIICVHNSAKYLARTLDSILAQTYTNFEVVIVDDYSTDCSLSIIEEYAKNIKVKIHILRNAKNIGLTKSLNRALKVADGNIIARIDADDIWLPKKLNTQIQFLEKNPDIIMCGTQYELIDTNGHKIKLQPRQLNCISPEIVKSALCQINPFCHSSVIFRKNEIISQIGYYNEDFKYSQDYEYWARINLIFKSVILNEVFVYKRVSRDIIGIRKRRLQSWYSFKALFFILRKYENTYITKRSYYSLVTKFLRALVPNFLVPNKTV